MRIAILAPLKRPITADTTVSRNRVIVDLAQELVKRAHQITIFATSDSVLEGVQIVGITPKGLNFMPATENPFYQHTSYLTQMIETAVIRQADFDLIHNHMYPEYLALLAGEGFKIPLLTTIHSQMVEETAQTLKKFPQSHLVAISQMAKKLAGIENMDVVHNSVDTDFFTPQEGIKNYLLAVGRMSSAKDEQGNFLDPKGIGNSIKIAQSLGEKLKIVGNVEDNEFFEKIVKPNLSDKIEFIGEVSKEQTLSREQMRDLYQNAKCFINPINWQEPFGLVMAESLACGTPVVAFNRGAVNEIVVDGLTGFVVDPNLTNSSNLTNLQIRQTGIEGMCEAVKKIDQIDRNKCREHAVANFSKTKMVDSYLQIYNKLVNK